MSSISPELYGTDIKPIAAGVGVAGGVTLVARFRFGVDEGVLVDSASLSAAVLRFLFETVGAFSSGSFSFEAAGAVLRFLPVFATFGGVSLAGFGSSLVIEAVALNRADFLEVILYILDWKADLTAFFGVVSPSQDRCSLTTEEIRARV